MDTFVKKQPVEPVVPVIADGILPSDWELKTIAEICEKVDKIDPTATPNAEIQYIDIGGIDNQLLRIVDTKTYLGKDAPSRARQLVKANDVVISTVRTYLKNIALVPDELDGQVASTGFCVLRSADPWMGRYLYYFVQSEAVLKEIAKQQRGTSYPAVRDSDIKAQFVPVPPKKDCKTIVEAIELQLGRLDAAVARLHAAKAKLKRYRQAVLKAAVEGPLLKGDYSWVTIEEASERIVDCLHSTPKFTEYGKYCIDTTCIEQGKIRFDKARFVSEESFTERIRRLKPEAGDILFAREGTVGTTVVVPEDVDLCLGQRMMMFRLKKFVVPKFFMYVMQSAIIVDKYRPLIMGTTAPHLNIRDIRKFTLPEYPMPLQQQIVARLDEIFEVLREQEFTLDTQLAHSTRLRQSVLKRAFEGRLI